LVMVSGVLAHAYLALLLTAQSIMVEGRGRGKLLTHLMVPGSREGNRKRPES
jgi:hypothetical protein